MPEAIWKTNAAGNLARDALVSSVVWLNQACHHFGSATLPVPAEVTRTAFEAAKEPQPTGPRHHAPSPSRDLCALKSFPLDKFTDMASASCKSTPGLSEARTDQLAHPSRACLGCQLTHAPKTRYTFANDGGHVQTHDDVPKFKKSNSNQPKLGAKRLARVSGQQNICPLWGFHPLISRAGPFFN